MTREEFVARYGGIYEHSRWVAEQVFDQQPIDDSINLAPLLAACVDRADEEVQLTLIRAHPDLAGKAAIAGELTEDSSIEQKRAGINQCTPEEFEEFQSLNKRYKDKFGFPFVMAVRNSTRQEILAAFAARLDNDKDTEFKTAISEIHQIAELRLSAMSEQ
jgi:2-oxo-4-hydroxy-4-carboxy-5-ureidoimidazoline decarboxylase